jgi:hypothetical protein
VQWLNIAVTLVLGLAVLGLVVLASADLLGLLRGPRWREASRSASLAPPNGPAPTPAASAPEANAIAEILYVRGESVEHVQPLPEDGSAFLGRQTYPGLPPEVAFRALEVAWRDGLPAVRNLDPACPAEMRVHGEAEARSVEAGGNWEPWPADADLLLAGYAMRWREVDPHAP